MIAVDTGPIVALFDKNDNYHGGCHNIIRTLEMPLATTIPVLTEAFYLLSFSWQLQDDLWEFIMQGNVRIYNLDRDLIKTCRELMRKYHDLPMDFTDASIVAVADAGNIRTIFTLDKDFKVYKTKQNKHFKLLPKELKGL
jgi:predicted nucleic acid-binding protein